MKKDISQDWKNLNDFQNLDVNKDPMLNFEVSALFMSSDDQKKIPLRNLEVIREKINRNFLVLMERGITHIVANTGTPYGYEAMKELVKLRQKNDFVLILAKIIGERFRRLSLEETLFAIGHDGAFYADSHKQFDKVIIKKCSVISNESELIIFSKNK